MLTQATGATPVHILGNVKETYLLKTVFTFHSSVAIQGVNTTLDNILLDAPVAFHVTYSLCTTSTN